MRMPSTAGKDFGFTPRIFICNKLSFIPFRLSLRNAREKSDDGQSNTRFPGMCPSGRKSKRQVLQARYRQLIFGIVNEKGIRGLTLLVGLIYSVEENLRDLTPTPLQGALSQTCHTAVLPEFHVALAAQPLLAPCKAALLSIRLFCLATSTTAGSDHSNSCETTTYPPTPSWFLGPDSSSGHRRRGHMPQPASQPLWRPLIYHYSRDTGCLAGIGNHVCTTGLTGTVLVSVVREKKKKEKKSKHVCGSVGVEKARPALGISACGLANSCLPGSSTRFMEEHVMCPPPLVRTSPFSSQTKEGQRRLGHTFLQVEEVQLYLLR